MPPWSYVSKNSTIHFGCIQLTVTVHVLDHNVISASDSHAIVLIKDGRISQSQTVCARDVETVRIMGSSKTARVGIRDCPSSVVQYDIVQQESVTTRDAKAMHWIILNVQVFDNRAADGFAYLKEVVGPRSD